jgi:hypothetical protein
MAIRKWSSTVPRSWRRRRVHDAKKGDGVREASAGCRHGRGFEDGAIVRVINSDTYDDTDLSCCRARSAKRSNAATSTHALTLHFSTVARGRPGRRGVGEESGGALIVVRHP